MAVEQSQKDLNLALDGLQEAEKASLTLDHQHKSQAVAEANVRTAEGKPEFGGGPVRQSFVPLAVSPQVVASGHSAMDRKPQSLNSLLQ